jgi:hypothetical protein
VIIDSKLVFILLTQKIHMIFYLSSASLLESSFSLFDGPAGGATDEADVGPLLEGDGVAGAGEWSSGSLKS